MSGSQVQIEKDVVYATHEGEALKGTLYRPAGAGPFPAIVALHGGGWRQASPTVYQNLGPWLAERGYLVFAPVYRSAKAGAPSYPKAVHDVRAAVQFVKGAGLGADPARVALMGESAGGHLASLVGLAGEEALFREGQPKSDHSALSSEVKAIISIYGVFDLVAQWKHDLSMRPVARTLSNCFSAPFLQKIVASLSMRRPCPTPLSGSTSLASFWLGARRMMWSIRPNNPSPFWKR